MMTEKNQTKDPGALWRNALATFINTSVEALGVWLDREYGEAIAATATPSEEEHAACVVDTRPALERAAALLKVSTVATVGEIRAAFRERVKEELTSGTFHDQGGDDTDERAQDLIAAKNLLIEFAQCREVANV